MHHSLHWWASYFRAVPKVPVGVIECIMRSPIPQDHTRLANAQPCIRPDMLPYLIFVSSYLMLPLTISLFRVSTRTRTHEREREARHEREEQRHA